MKILTVHRPLPWLALGLAVIAAAFGLAACGGDDGKQASATGTERAFLQGMVPHHESAIEMAKLAQERGEHAQVRRLGEAIVDAQEGEIRQIKRMHQSLFGEPLVPDAGAPERLGMSADEAGMGHDGGAMLEDAKQFDRAFIDEMVAHHQGAIRMARTVLSSGPDADVTRLAHSIVTAQTKEIADMNRWRSDWYGRPSPAGGVASEEPMSGEGMDSGGGEHEGR